MPQRKHQFVLLLDCAGRRAPRSAAPIRQRKSRPQWPQTELVEKIFHRRAPVPRCPAGRKYQWRERAWEELPNCTIGRFRSIHTPIGGSSQSSSSTPPAAEGCTKTYKCPPAPTLISSVIRRVPLRFNSSTVADKSSTLMATWCSP